ncbi:hypothetical protein DFJ77DRAFT_510906 [Powellomyces hirtus]|nr:hypothetical protein DFJ77DRAFT_510906 [Powellomyces hirtus]
MSSGFYATPVPRRPRVDYEPPRTREVWPYSASVMQVNNTYVRIRPKWNAVLPAHITTLRDPDEENVVVYLVSFPIFFPTLPDPIALNSHAFSLRHPTEKVFLEISGGQNTNVEGHPFFRHVVDLLRHVSRAVGNVQWVVYHVLPKTPVG